MNLTTTGWLIFIVALGMMSGLLSSDIARLKDWHEIYNPSFVAIIMSHFATVVTAFIGGKLIPATRNDQMTRSTDVVKVPEVPPGATSITTTVTKQ